jgi:transposase InsO family protein
MNPLYQAVLSDASFLDLLYAFDLDLAGRAQAMQKRGLPRSAMSDNGAAMTAAEISEGLARLGILHQTTLPYSPYQNGKQEVLWGPAML